MIRETIITEAAHLAAEDSKKSRPQRAVKIRKEYRHEKNYLYHDSFLVRRFFGNRQRQQKISA
jgi:hypothetical protein